jgi:hypothetical protein
MWGVIVVFSQLIISERNLKKLKTKKEGVLLNLKTHQSVRYDGEYERLKLQLYLEIWK